MPGARTPPPITGRGVCVSVGVGCVWTALRRSGYDRRLRLRWPAVTAYTQSGFPVIADYGDPQLVPNPVIPGTDGVKVLGGLRRGPVAAVLLYILGRWHAEVEPVVQDQGVWGFTPKKITGGDGSTWSNHAGGCAFDANSAIHPQGAATMSGAKIAAVRKIVGDVNAMAGKTVVDWGGEWSGRTRDEMHVQIHGNVDQAALAGVAETIIHGGSAEPKPPVTPEDIVTKDQLVALIKTDDDVRRALVGSVVDKRYQTLVRDLLTPVIDARFATLVRDRLSPALRRAFGKDVSL